METSATTIKTIQHAKKESVETVHAEKDTQKHENTLQITLPAVEKKSVPTLIQKMKAIIK